MPEYSRDVFSKYSKEKLLNYIEQQNDQVGRLETRFRGNIYIAAQEEFMCECAFVDVVRAYKGVLKEKEALEATIKALSVAQEEYAESASLTIIEHNEAVRSEASEGVESEGHDGVKSEARDGMRSEPDFSEASDSGAENRSTASLREHFSPSGTVHTLCTPNL